MSVNHPKSDPPDVPLPNVSLIQTPPGMFDAAVTLGERKANQPFSTTVILGTLAGAYIATGAFVAMSVGGASPGIAAANPGLHRFLTGAIGIPMGLTLAVTAGGDLFTGNAMLVTAALLMQRATPGKLARNWLASYIGNVIGALGIVFAAVSSDVVTPGAAETVTALASSKVGLPFGVVFERGVLANWLVCVAVYSATGSKTYLGKLVPILLSVSAFFALGFDHFVANMFFIPFAIALGADITLWQLVVENLIPVTLGNVVGGAVPVAGMYYLAYGQKAKTPGPVAGTAPPAVPTASPSSASLKKVKKP